MLSAENSTEKLMSRTNFCPSDIWNSEWQKVQMYLWKIAPEDKCYDTILPLTWFLWAWQWSSLFLAMWNKKNVLFSYYGVELEMKIMRKFAKISKSWRRLLPGPSPGWKHLLTISHLSRGLLRDCDIFAKFRLTFVSSSTTETDIYQYLWGLNIHWGSEFACFCTNPTFIMWANFHNLYKKWKCLQ